MTIRIKDKIVGISLLLLFSLAVSNTAFSSTPGTSPNPAYSSAETSQIQFAKNVHTLFVKNQLIIIYQFCGAKVKKHVSLEQFIDTLTKTKKHIALTIGQATIDKVSVFRHIDHVSSLGFGMSKSGEKITFRFSYDL